MIAFPNAKINLGLNITERRPDGYHNLESVFYPVSLHDMLEVLPSDEFSFSSGGIDIDASPADNLVTKAYKLLARDYNLPPVKIHLHKTIPLGAGLGGGSSDAAHMLKLLNELFETGISDNDLRQFASKLGADCPFFIGNKPVFASGIGDIFSPVPIHLHGYHIAIVKPPVSVNTARAYSLIVPSKTEVRVADAIKHPLKEWKEVLVNDFEAPVFRMFPEIAAVKETMYENGALYAAMSGSGSAVFGIFENKPVHLDNLFPEDYFVWYEK